MFSLAAIRHERQRHGNMLIKIMYICLLQAVNGLKAQTYINFCSISRAFEHGTETLNCIFINFNEHLN